MKNHNKKYALLRFVFALVGLFLLIKIVKGYGVDLIIDEFSRSGVLLILLVFTFIPTLVCYACSWLLATDHEHFFKPISFVKKIFIFFKITVVSIAWNNLTPFLKVGGEPLKYIMLKKYLTKDDALASAVNYNIIHLLSTGISFVITAIVVIFFYETPEHFKGKLITFASILTLGLVLIFVMMNSKHVGKSSNVRFKWLREALIKVKSSYGRLVLFYQNNPTKFFISLGIDVFARFIEGLTFYFSFYLIKHQISFLSSCLLDVGRTFVDTIFFFVPYQMGSREQGVRFFMDHILAVNSKGYLTSVFLYRLVEIFWVLTGYIIWMISKSSSKDESV